MREITTSLYTFENLIRHNCIYIDKTKYIYKMLAVANGQFFCSRPRRFGKSLTVSTLEAVFKGKRELFKSLYLGSTDYDWSVHPVIHIDFGRVDMESMNSLTESLLDILVRCAKEYNVSIERTTPARAFELLISALYDKTGKGVVLLIDEYDKPILEHVDSMKDAEQYRDYIGNFYQIIKGSERYLRFTFITGVTKFAKVSIFSKLNNLDDITMNPSYGTMFGYTQDEFESYFKEYIDKAIDDTGMKRDELLAEIKNWYDGFKFADKSLSVYNPVSIGSFFNNDSDFENYWFATGTPTFLMKLLRSNHIVLSDLPERTLNGTSFNTFNLTDLAQTSPDDERLTQLLYQTGYLTIDKLLWSSPDKVYQLKFPNFEVSYSFAQNLLSEYAPKASATDNVTKVRLAAMSGDTAAMIEHLRAFFSALPYDIQVKEEKYYQSIVYTIFRMCNMKMMTEVTTSIGRIDGVLDAGKHLYIIEFKLNKSADTALEQIDEKKYADSFILPAKEKGQAIHKLGINFSYDEKTRNVSDWKEEIIGG
ncbi:MAG: AAA family ATPase [Selenomonadaceae bacterium]